MTKIPPANTVDRAKRLYQSWAEADATLACDDLTLTIYAEQIADAEARDHDILAAEAYLKRLREARRKSRAIVYDSTKRVMNLAKGQFGDDSVVYKLLGGTPISERARAKKSNAI